MVEVKNVTHRFGRRGSGTVLAVDDVSFDVPDGQFLAVVGPSGCGKTTVLNMAAGLVRPSGGEVLVAGQPVKGCERSVGYMFARDGLLPWRTALANVAFGLELRGVPGSRRNQIAAELLHKVGLAGFEQAYRAQLSHGMRQRVALARTMAIDPKLLLLDEPFAALDAQTKIVLQEEFVRLWESARRTVMLVTHDIAEAVAMADRVIVFSHRPGRIVADIAIDLPRPRDIEAIRFDARFIDLARSIWLHLTGKAQS
jgi:NitT/TauT family transport system ATP-binding protein